MSTKKTFWMLMVVIAAGVLAYQFAPQDDDPTQENSGYSDKVSYNQPVGQKSFASLMSAPW